MKQTGKHGEMTMKKRTIRTFLLGLIVFVSVAWWSFAQEKGDGNVLNSAADKSVAIRFFYDPPGDSFLFPLIFRVADPNDPRYNTAPLLDAGRTAYLSLSDMRRLLPDLAHLPLLWRHAETVEAFGSYNVLQLTDTMDVKVVSSHGTARAAIPSKKVCETLSSMDSAISTPRALWEFQLFRRNYGCKVPAFDIKKYPDHWE